MDAEYFLHAYWKAAHKQLWKSAALSETPPPLAVSLAIDGALLSFRGDEWTFTGHVCELATLCARVYWRFGWSLPPSHSSEHTIGAVAWNTYRAAAERLIALSDDLPQRDRAQLLGMLADYQLDEARTRLAKVPASTRNKILDDDDETFIAKELGGKGSASRLAILKNIVVGAKDPRPLQRRRVALSAADAVAGEAYGEAASFAAASAPLLALLEDPEASVRDAAALHLHWLGEFLVARDAFAEALPLLDRALRAGSVFIDAHAWRFRARLALGMRKEADEDWQAFSAACEKIANASARPEVIRRAARALRLDALIDAAVACHWRGHGLPSNEGARKRKKRPAALPAAERKRWAGDTSALIDEARAELGRLGTPLYGNDSMQNSWQRKHARMNDPSDVTDQLDDLAKGRGRYRV